MIQAAYGHFLLSFSSWLSESEGDKQTERELTVKPPDGRPWTITTVTANSSDDSGKESGNSGKDSDDSVKTRVPGPAVLVLYGDKGRSKPMQFGDDLDFVFEEGQSQEFLVHVRKNNFLVVFNSTNCRLEEEKP